MDYSPAGSSVCGISQARMLERVAISFSKACSLLRDWTHVSCLAGEFFTIEPPGKPDLHSTNNHKWTHEEKKKQDKTNPP